MRIATYNVEWFNALFDDSDRLIADDRWSGRQGVTRAVQARALAHVLRALDADGVMVIEAPDTNRRRSTVRSLQGFAAGAGLRTRAAITGFPNGSQQEIAFLFDPDRLRAEHAPQADAAAPRFDGVFRLAIDPGGAPEPVTFSKPPLELLVRAPGGTELRLIGVHIKSKTLNGASEPAEILRLSRINRRKQQAQCIWLRHRVESILAAGESVIVLGDFNDGPGLDEHEALLGRSGVEIVLGEPGTPQLFDPHARHVAHKRTVAAPSTARFLTPDDGYISALLDYVMISPDLRAHRPRWRIWHPFDDPHSYRDAELRQALLDASDHFPVTLDLDL